MPPRRFRIDFPIRIAASCHLDDVCYNAIHLLQTLKLPASTVPFWMTVPI